MSAIEILLQKYGYFKSNVNALYDIHCMTIYVEKQIQKIETSKLWYGLDVPEH